MTREDEPGLGLELPVNRAPAHDLTGISAAAPKETLGAVVAGAACAGSLVFFLLEIPRYRTLFWLIWPSRSSIGKACLVRAHFLPVVVERFRRGAKRRGAQAATQGLAWSARLASIFSLTILCASVAAALPPIANFMARSPITEEASNPNEQASAQIASHELRARDLLRMITSHKEQDTGMWYAKT